MSCERRPEEAGRGTVPLGCGFRHVGRQRGKSAQGGEALLVIVGLVIAAAVAVKRLPSAVRSMSNRRETRATVADEWIALEVEEESARRWFRKTKQAKACLQSSNNHYKTLICI